MRKTTRISDLPLELVGEEILARVPLTSLRKVRSTCKSWNAISKNLIVSGKSAARQHFLGFTTKNSKVCSVKGNLIKTENMFDLIINEVDVLNQIEISRVVHGQGLLLCVVKDNSNLVIWNPYLNETRFIKPRENFHRLDKYALGNHKILRFVDCYFGSKLNHIFGFEIYDLSSDSWRVFELVPDWEIDPCQQGMSLKANTYFIAHKKIGRIVDFDGTVYWINDLVENFVLCFDFTTERFGQRLSLPFHSNINNHVALSCVREQHGEEYCNKIEIWVTTRIEPNNVSWSKFFKVDFDLFIDRQYFCDAEIFFVEEDKHVVALFDLQYIYSQRTDRHNIFSIGQCGFCTSLSLKQDSLKTTHRPGFMSTSYLPSLALINRKGKRKERDV